MSYCVYMHTSPSGKRYVGITAKEPTRRWKEGRGYNHNRHFTRAVAKYGWDSIRHEILLSDLAEEQAERWERFFIAMFRTTEPAYGYNQTTGGEIGKEFSEETLKRMSAAQKGEKSHKFGKRESEETRKKKSDALKGRQFSKEHKQKLSESRTGQKIGPFSAEHRRKIGDALKGKRQSAEHNRKNGDAHSRSVLNLDTLEIYSSIKAAAECYGVSPTAIGLCLRGQNKSAAGCHWAYANDKTALELFIAEKKKGPLPKRNAKAVINLDTGEIFLSIALAARSCGFSETGIGKCCRGKAKTAGGYHWGFAENYETAHISLRECEPKSRSEIMMAFARRVINLDTGEIFDSLKSAAEHYGLSEGNLCGCCRGKHKRCGGYHWAYADQK